MPDAPETAPKVIEILAAIVGSGGEATGFQLIETCNLTKAQLARQLAWMEKQDLVNQVQSHDGRRWVRATVAGREVLKRTT